MTTLTASSRTTTQNFEMPFSQIPEEFHPIIDKVLHGERITDEEGLLLFTKADSTLLQNLSNFVRKQRHGDIVHYSHTLYIHPTNLCELSCPMCSFYAKPGWEKAWFMKPEDVEKKVQQALSKGICEVHIVGGLWRDCNLDYYKDIFTRIRSIDPKLHIKALTPVEYDFLARLHGITITEVFEKMISWGLGSLPGGGAEILVEEIRQKVAPGKISSKEYLDIHEKAHTLGLHSNVTMLFGHIESPHHIISHLSQIRLLQDRTGGFQTFVPLKYHEENNALGKRKDRLQPKDVRRVYAISRIMLDNIPGIKVLWNYVGLDEAQEILDWGANDFSSTSLEEKIITMAGGIKVAMTEDIMEKIIEAKGRQARKIHSGLVQTNLARPKVNISNS